MTIAAGVSGQNSTASGTTITTTISAPSVGDFMVAVATATATVGTLSIDGTGWTEHANQTVAATTIRTVIWTREVTSTGDTSYTVTSTNTDTINLHLMTFSGITAGALDAAAVENEDTADATSIAFGSLTTVASESLAILACALQNTPGGSGPAAPAGFTDFPTRGNRRLNTYYRIGSATALSGTLTWTNLLQDSQSVIISFASGAAGGGVPRVMFHRRMQGMS